MTMRSITTALLGASLAAVLVPAGAAYAGSTTVQDEASDVWESVWNSETETEDMVEAGSVHNIDVDKLVVRHTARRIGLTATYEDLKKQEIVLGAASKLRFDDG